MIEFFTMDETNGRLRRPNDEHAWLADADDIEDCEDDELGFFGIVARKKYVSPCPYDKEGNYVPRGLRK